MNTLVYVETDGDREAMLTEHLVEGHVYARGRSNHSEHAYVLWTRHPKTAVRNLERLEWVTLARSLHKSEREWDDLYAEYLSGWVGWVEDPEYHGPDITLAELDLFDVMHHMRMALVRGKWDGRWSGVVLAPQDDGSVILVAVLLPSDEVPTRLTFPAGIRFVKGDDE